MISVKKLSTSLLRAHEAASTLVTKGYRALPDGGLKIERPGLNGTLDVCFPSSIKGLADTAPLIQKVCQAEAMTYQIFLSIGDRSTKHSLRQVINDNLSEIPELRQVIQMQVQALTPTKKFWLTWTTSAEDEPQSLVMLKDKMLYTQNIVPGENIFLDTFFGKYDLYSEKPFETTSGDLASTTAKPTIVHLFLIPQAPETAIVDIQVNVQSSSFGRFNLII